MFTERRSGMHHRKSRNRPTRISALKKNHPFALHRKKRNLTRKNWKEVFILLPPYCFWMHPYQHVHCRQVYPGVETSAFSRSAKEAEALMADGQRILSRLSASRALAHQIMTAAQSNQKIPCLPCSGKPASAASLMPLSIPTASASYSSAPAAEYSCYCVGLSAKKSGPQKRSRIFYKSF